jgi:3'-phosphoadenosine 5'-phosphosulfate sulfotransferase (PAPS reductase)/FAD synthetase
MAVQEEFSLSQEDFTAKAATKSYLAKPGRNPFLIDEPTVISFSGGRTSAYMLWRVLEANGGLPEDAIVCFANTGKEEEATLEFVRDCEVNWGIKIHWIEYRNDEVGFAKVDFDSASRNGEPFEALIKKVQFLPSAGMRICTTHLKIRPFRKYLDSIGIDRPLQFVGIRADEMRRVVKIRANPQAEGMERCVPLADAGVKVQDVNDFWSKQPFNLNLTTFNGRTLAGNCDLCFLKPASQILSLIKEKPERAIWWAKMESLDLSKQVSGNKQFSKNRPSYAEMLKFSKEQHDMFDQNEEAIPCFCGD